MIIPLAEIYNHHFTNKIFYIKLQGLFTSDNRVIIFEFLPLLVPFGVLVQYNSSGIPNNQK